MDKELQIILKAKDEASKVIKDVAKKGSVDFQAIASAAGKSFMIAGAAVAGFAALSVKAAADAEVEMARFDATLKNIGASGLKARDSILKMAQASVKLGFDDEETANSVAYLLQRTNDLSQAQKLNALAMDLARAKNIGLTQATQMVGMVLSGNGKILKQYGIDIKETANPMEALADLQAKVGGQAQAFSQTYAGAMQAFNVASQNVLETIGEKLLPILTKLTLAILPLLEGAISVVEVAFKALSDWWNTQGQPVFNFISISINYLWQQLQGLWQAFSELLVLLEPALTQVLQFLGQIIGATLVAAIVVFVQSLGFIIETIKVAIQIINLLIKGLTWLVETITFNVIVAIQSLGDAWNKVWQGIKDIFSQVYNWIMDKIQSLLDGINRVINGIKNAASSVGKGISSTISSISGKRADGGQVLAGSTYLVGERGAELFTPSVSGFISPNEKIGNGNITININGGYYLDKNAADDFSNLIIKKLKLQTSI